MTCSMLPFRSELALGFCPRAIEAVARTRTAVTIVRLMESSPLNYALACAFLQVECADFGALTPTLQSRNTPNQLGAPNVPARMTHSGGWMLVTVDSLQRTATQDEEQKQKGKSRS